MSQLQLFARLAKVDVEKRQVTGVIASETPDAANEIFDYDTSKPNFEKWSGTVAKLSGGKSVGNVRAMHSNVAAGALSDIVFDDVAKTIAVTADIVDDNEWNKVLKGVYTGFSIGGKYVKKWADKTIAKAKRYTADPNEVSIVDIGCNPDATFTMVKADGMETQVKFEDTEHGIVSKLADPETSAEEKIELVQKLAAMNGLELAKSEPAAVEGEGEDLQKGAYTIDRLACLAESIESLLSYTNWTVNGQTVDGAGASTIPAQLKTAANAMYDALLSCVSTDVAEAKNRLKSVKKLLDETDGEPLRKAEGLACTVDTLAKAIGYTEEPGGPTLEDCVVKFVADRNDLQKKYDEQSTKLTELESELAKFKEQPAPAKGVAKVVGKTDDGVTVQKSEQAPEPESNDPFTLMKRVHSAGGQRITLGDVLTKKQ
jgi:hypothetical protein